MKNKSELWTTFRSDDIVSKTKNDKNDLKAQYCLYSIHLFRLYYFPCSAFVLSFLSFYLDSLSKFLYFVFVLSV